MDAITRHRARTAIATQLDNAKGPMTVELDGYAAVRPEPSMRSVCGDAGAAEESVECCVALWAGTGGARSIN